MSSAAIENIMYHDQEICSDTALLGAYIPIEMASKSAQVGSSASGQYLLGQLLLLFCTILMERRRRQDAE
jgi:hypothetical protein